MRLKYVITPICGLSIENRFINTIKKDADGRRRIYLLPEVAEEYVAAGWIVLDDTAPPAQIDIEEAPEYDFKGSTVRNARPPTNRYSDDHTLANPHVGSDKGALVLVDSTSAVVITLPNDWEEGDGAVIRRVGAGDVSWALAAGATKELPASRIAHTKILERHSEILVRVISNPDGKTAVWAIEGATA